MKTIAKLVMILIVGVLLSLLIYPVSRTTWADGVRERVQKIRAQRRAAMMASQKTPDGKSADGKSADGKSADGKSADGKTAVHPAGKVQTPGEAGKRKGPMPKPPTCSAAAFLQGGKSLVQILIPCLLTALILLIHRCVTIPKSGNA